MSKRTLVEQLEYWRAERPDEWTMEDFIRDAKKEAARIAELERQLAELRQPTAQQVEDARDAARYRWLRENHAAKEHWYDEEGIEAVRLEFAAVGDTLEEAIESEMRNLCKQERRKSMDDFSSMQRSEMIQRATWMVLQSVLRGELESGVHQAINFAFNWKHAVDTKKASYD